MGTVTGNEAESQEEEEDDDEQDDLDLKSSSIVRLRRMTHTPIERLAPWTKFGLVRTISKTTHGSGQSGDFVIMTNSEMRTGKIKNTGLCNPPADTGMDHEENSSLDQLQAAWNRQVDAVTCDTISG